MALINDLILERVKALTLSNVDTGELAVRLKAVKDGNLTTTAEGTPVTGAIGETIATIWGAETAQFTATSALYNLGFAAAQFGTEKEVASTEAKISTWKEQVIDVVDGKLTLEKMPKANSVKYVYQLVNGDIAKKYTLAVGEASEGTFTITEKVITLPADAKGKFYVEYEYESETAAKVSKKVGNMPGAYLTRIYFVAHDKCNINDIYTGVIIAKRGEIDPSSIEMGINAEGGQPVTINFNKAYCDDDEELFSIILDD